jgi:hypothetical protein
MNSNGKKLEDETVAETENLLVWRSREDEVGYVYHLEIGNMTIHLMAEEWEELTSLIRAAS